MLRGQGRCILSAHENPDKYYDTVLWACSNIVSYNPQCKGTHSEYIYDLINYYVDTEPFFETVVKSFEKV